MNNPILRKMGGRLALPRNKLNDVNMAALGRFLPPTILSRRSGVCRSQPPATLISASPIEQTPKSSKPAAEKYPSGLPQHESEMQSSASRHHSH